MSPRAAKPSKPARPAPTLLIDTREQHPYDFADAVAAGRCAGVECVTLRTADYSVRGLEDVVGVERKSLDDFVGSITAGRERFFRELERLRLFMFPRVVVEGSLAQVHAGTYRSRTAPRAVLGTALSIEIDFGIPVVWAGGRAEARDYVERFLLRVAARGGGITAPAAPIDGEEREA